MPEITNDIDVELISAMTAASDLSVVNAARVSTQGNHVLENKKESEGLINFLMKNRHGTPFEHNTFTFFIQAPIFVFREFHRHRIGWSYNEESGRYKELEGKFYIPPRFRNLTQTGKPGAYEFLPGSDEQFLMVANTLAGAYLAAYNAYKHMLDNGIAKEVARMCLPVAVYSSMYATCNARSLMAFLSLRQKRTSSQATFPSTPMKEINIVADKMEEFFERAMPITHAAFKKNGYVSP